ncbi:MAG: permease [Candidatus Thiodiazotropha sp.]
MLLVIACYVIAWLYDSRLALDILGFSGGLLYKLIPALFLVFAIIFLSNLLIRPDWVGRHVGKDSGVKGWLVAIIGGILSVGPVYPWYALLKDLRAKGMRTALIAVFLYNRGIKLPLLPLMIHYFGLAYTIILALYLTIFSLLAGVIMERFGDDENTC